MSNSLLHPDDPMHSDETGYSPAVATALTRAYADLKYTPDRLNGFQRAQRRLRSCLEGPMSARQRMRALYVLGMTYTAVHAFDGAHGCLEDALDLSLHLQDAEAFCELAFLQAHAYSLSFHYRLAHSFYSLSISGMEALGDEADPVIAAGALVGLAGCEFLQEHYAPAVQLLDEASNVVRRSEAYTWEAAMVEWVRAALWRWHDQPEQALRHAMSAADMIAEFGANELCARLFADVAQCALDLAEAFRPGAAGGGRASMVALAESYIGRAHELAQGLTRRGAEGVATLAQMRASRLCGRPADRMATIEAVACTAEHLGDPRLLAQVYTALGDELANQQDDESARVYYRRALDAAKVGGVPAMGKWARRALLRMSEMHTES
jgi:tetratricopeptide (TPR) repeat protein